MLLLSALHAVAPVEAFFQDVLLRLMPERAATRVVVVAIDEQSLQREGPWPWPRAKLAAVVTAVADSGAPIIGIDLLLNDGRAGDGALAAACRRTRCVAAATLDDRGEWILPAASLRPNLDPVHATFELDDDGILRRISVTKQDQRLSLPAFAVQLAALASGSPIAPGRAVIPAFRAAPHDLTVVSATDVLRGDRTALAQLRGRIVVLGLTAFALGDRVMTPRSRRNSADSGVLVHAAAVESLLAGDIIRELSPIAAALLAVALVWAAAAIGALGGSRRIVTESLLVLAPAGAATVLIFAHIVIPAVSISAVVAITVIAIEARRALALMRHGRAAVETLQGELGEELTGNRAGDVGLQLESLAAAIVRRRVDDVESKRVVAHELKTPLAAMRNLSQLLTGFELTAGERHRVATLLGDEAKKLQAMITGLLEVEQLALRKGLDRQETLDLARMIASRAELLASGLARKVDVTSDGSIRISGNAALLERAVDNLVGNAAKYSPASQPVRVAVRLEGGLAVIDVMDRGPGVPADERDRIFRRFARGTAAAGTDGLGLGLALVAEVVRWHGGTIEVLERAGGGSIFRVRLPVTAVSTDAEAV